MFKTHVLTYFVHNVVATVSYDRKEHLDIRTAIAHLELDEDLLFNKPDAKYILLSRDQTQTPIISVKSLLTICRRVSKLPLASVLLANVQSLENKMCDLRLRISYQWDIKNFSILCFTDLWLNVNTDTIELAGYSVHRQDREATSGKTRGGHVCQFVNNRWCTISNIKEVSRYCSP